MKLTKSIDKYDSYKVRGISHAIFTDYDTALYASGYDATRVMPQTTKEEKAENTAKAAHYKKKRAEKKELEISLTETQLEDLLDGVAKDSTREALVDEINETLDIE